MHCTRTLILGLKSMLPWHCGMRRLQHNWRYQEDGPSPAIAFAHGAGRILCVLRPRPHATPLARLLQDCLSNKKYESRCDLYVKEKRPQPPPPPPNLPWPYPNDPGLSYGSSTVELDAAFEIKLDAAGANCDTLQGAAQRYKELTIGSHVGSHAAHGLKSLDVSVADLDESHPQLGDDESYELEVSATAASLSAQTIWGAMRGLETFSQLVMFNFTSKSYTVPKHAHMAEAARRAQYWPCPTPHHSRCNMPHGKLKTRPAFHTVAS